MADMNDRELLELAAKAAGYKLDGMAARHIAQGVGPDDMLRLNDRGGHSVWSPLTDDGDALRLAVKLKMSVEISDYEASTYAYAGDVPRLHAMELWRDDRDAATRRAIVRAAAEIGLQHK